MFFFSPFFLLFLNNRKLSKGRTFLPILFKKAKTKNTYPWRKRPKKKPPPSPENARWEREREREKNEQGLNLSLCESLNKSKFKIEK